MARIQCKMCGGDLTLPEGIASGNCEYCGCLVTFPKISNDQIENLYNRAEHFRKINDYEKAVATYEKLVISNPNDPEVYWGLVLSRYGIEYVEDPISHERIPTCHRVQFESILTDSDYLTTLKYAGEVEKNIYQKEAEKIAKIQKDILAISQNEEPFDVFICYKESDATGKRTKDSVIAQDIYFALKQEGIKTFFARITLEEKLGQQYEPYIFAALNSAKVMLVIGSKTEYFNATWVRNEWTRFLALMKNDKNKLIIPCYKDMDAYDIPEELSMFQAQDMNKIGFMQDIFLGIKKVTQGIKNSNVSKQENLSQTGKNNPILRRVKLFLEEQDFESANKFCENVLNQEPENGWAYFYRMMSELKISEEDNLSDAKYSQNKSYQLAKRFADAELKEKIASIDAKKERKKRDIELRKESFERSKKLNKSLDLEKTSNKDNQVIANLEQAIAKELALRKNTDLLTDDVASSTEEYTEKVFHDLELRKESLERSKKLNRVLALEKALNKDNQVIANLEQAIAKELDLRKNTDLLTEDVVSPIKKYTTGIMISDEAIHQKETSLAAKRTQKYFILFFVVFLIIFLPILITTIWQNKSLNKGDVCKIKSSVVIGTKFSNKQITKCVIPAGVTEIANGAFSNCYNLERVSVPNSVKKIGSFAFDQCSNLKEIVIPIDCEIETDSFPSTCKVIRLNEEAKKVYDAASNGDVNSQYLLAKRYMEHNGVDENPKELLRWLKSAAENGHSESQRILGNCYAKGLFIPQDNKEAVKWIKKSAEQDNTEAMVSLAHCYIKGFEVEKDVTIATKWLIKAADKNNAQAQYSLGFCYFNGNGVEKDIAKAILLYQKSAEKGNTLAQNALGECYLTGNGIEKKPKEAVKFFKKAADKKLPLAIYNLAYLYYYGIGVEQDHAEAIELLKKISDKKIPQAQHLLALCYYNGHGIEKDTTEAIRLFEVAANNNHTESQYIVGYYYYKNNLYEEAVKWFAAAAEKEHVQAQHLLALCYYNGHGFEKDTTEAIRLFEIAANNGNTESQYILGCHYYKNKSYEETVKWLTKAAEKEHDKAQHLLGKIFYEANNPNAIQWLQKSALKNNTEAQYLLGKCYFNGTLVEKNYNDAVKWLTKAAEQKNSDAIYKLALYYYNGQGVEKNYNDAVKWLTKAAEQQNLDAIYKLALCYYNGQGVKKNYNEAVKWLTKAAEQQNLDAIYKLALCYYNGQGVKKNYNEAVKWLTKAAEQSHPGAQEILGLCFYWGIGVKKNYNEAVKWLSKAAIKGYSGAQAILGLCFYKGEGIEKNRTEAVKWLLKATETENKGALAVFALCFYKGNSIEKYRIDAVKWLSNATKTENEWTQVVLRYKNEVGDHYIGFVEWLSKVPESGYAHAQFILAQCFYNGLGVKKNYYKAVKFYYNAALKGNFGAKNILYNNEHILSIIRHYAQSGDKDAKIIMRKIESHIKEKIQREEKYRIARKSGLSFAHNGQTLIQCNNKGLKECVIPDGVTSIGQLAFSKCSKLTSITIPNSVKYISSEAFSKCNSLTSVTIPSGTKFIGYSAFSWCQSLRSVNIQNGVESIASKAFYGCFNLTSVKIPNSVKSIGYEAFEGCDRLEKVYISKDCKVDKSFPAGTKIIRR